ncbi:MAG: hypothetical protein RLZZ117_649 [Cyanobacteriota bacterium]|jgi:hypothetical protein
MTFQPRAIQMVAFVPDEQVDPTDGFEEVEGYSTTSAGAGGWSAGSADDGEGLF